MQSYYYFGAIMRNFTLILILLLFTSCGSFGTRDYYWLDQEDTNRVHLLSPDYIEGKKRLYDSRQKEFYWLSARDLHRFDDLPAEYIANMKLVYESIRDSRIRDLKRQEEDFKIQQCYYSNRNFIDCMTQY